MSKLSRDFGNICRHNNDGSHKTQHDRRAILGLMADQLKEMGYNGLRVQGLGTRHINALVDRWRDDGIARGTFDNRMATIRWVAGKIGKENIVERSNSAYKFASPRERVATTNAAIHLHPQHLEKMNDQLSRFSAQLQEQFGMRPEESVLFRVAKAYKNDGHSERLEMVGSWCKNGRPRNIPVETHEQRQLLREIKMAVGKRSLIPDGDKSFQQYNRLQYQMRQKAGIRNPHGLRHAYAQRVYRQEVEHLLNKNLNGVREELRNGWKSPIEGGPPQKELNPVEREIDRTARMEVARRLGHGREEVTNEYLGK